MAPYKIYESKEDTVPLLLLQLPLSCLLELILKHAILISSGKLILFQLLSA